MIVERGNIKNMHVPDEINNQNAVTGEKRDIVMAERQSKRATIRRKNPISSS